MDFDQKTSRIFVVGHSGLRVDGWDSTLDGKFFVPGKSD